MFRKRLIPLLLIALLSQSIFAQSVVINETETPTIEVENSIYIPLRSLTEQLNETLGYSNGIATIVKDGVIYAINIADKTLITNNTKINKKDTGDILIQVINGVTYIPLETFADIFNVGTSYNEQTGTIEISKENKDTYSKNLKNNIKELDQIIANTIDEEELNKLKEKRSLLYRTYLEYRGYVTFSVEYSGEEKKELIKNILEEVRIMTSSSLATSKSEPKKTSTDDVSGIGELPKLLGLYAYKGYDKQTGNAAYIATAKFKIDGKYYGGSIDYALYANGLEISKSYVSWPWDTDEYTNRVFGTGYILINQYALDKKGYVLDTNTIGKVIYKTNIFGDHELTFDENGDFIYGEPSYHSQVKNVFLNFISDTPLYIKDPPEVTTESMYTIDIQF